MPNRFEIIKELEQKRKALLKKYPDLCDMQNTLQEKLSNAGSSDNRLVLLNTVMMEKFCELNDALQDFSSSRPARKARAWK